MIEIKVYDINPLKNRLSKLPPPLDETPVQPDPYDFDISSSCLSKQDIKVILDNKSLTDDKYNKYLECVDRLHEYGVSIHSVLFNHVQPFEKYPIVFQCSFNNYKVVSLYQKDNEGYGDIHFLFTRCKELDAYADLFYCNTGKDRAERFFHYLSNKEDYFDKWINNPVKNVLELSKEGFIVEKLVHEEGHQAKFHYLITIPKELQHSGIPNLINDDDSNMCFKSLLEKQESKNRDILAHKYTFALCDTSKGHRFSVSTNRHLDYNCHDGISYGRIEDHVVWLDNPTPFSIRDAVLGLDRKIYTTRYTHKDLNKISNKVFKFKNEYSGLDIELNCEGIYVDEVSQQTYDANHLEVNTDGSLNNEVGCNITIGVRHEIKINVSKKMDTDIFELVLSEKVEERTNQSHFPFAKTSFISHKEYHNSSTEYKLKYIELVEFFNILCSKLKKHKDDDSYNDE